MRELLYKFFIEDFLLKLIAIVIAVALVFVVRTELEASTAIYVRVQYTQPRGRILVSEEPPDQVKVVVRGPWARITRASQAGLPPIVIDLSEYNDGEQRMTADMVSLPEDLRVESFDPPSIYMRYETEAKVSLPVQLTIEGELAEGYRLKKITVSPSTVRIHGAQDVLENMRNVLTRPLNIASFTGTATVSVDLGPLPKHAAFVENPPPRITAEVAVEQFERRIANVSIRPTGPAQNIKVTPEVAAIVLRGQGLEKLQEMPVPVLDTTAEERKPPGTTYVKRLQVTNLPPGIAYEVTPREVQFTILKSAPAEKEPVRKPQ
jgi:YbbR domain-containing protein